MKEEEAESSQKKDIEQCIVRPHVGIGEGGEIRMIMASAPGYFFMDIFSAPG